LTFPCTAGSGSGSSDEDEGDPPPASVAHPTCDPASATAAPLSSSPPSGLHQDLPPLPPAVHGSAAAAVTTSERPRNPAPSRLLNTLPIPAVRPDAGAAAWGNLSSTPMLLDQDLPPLPPAAHGSAVAAVTTSERPGTPPPSRLLNLQRPGLTAHGRPAGAHLPSPIMLLEWAPSAPQRPHPPATAAGSGGGGSGSGLQPAGPKIKKTPRPRPRDFSPPVLPYQLPSKATVRALVSARMLGKGRYGRKALAGKQGPYKAELQAFKELCTSTDRLAVNSLRTKLGFSGGMSAATYQRYEAVIIRFLGWVQSMDPSTPISLHLYITRTDLFFLFLASLLYRADGNPDELHKHLLVR
jgi:hypothetical protein